LSDALLSRSATLLTLLNNPLNIQLLSRHLLSSPAIWVHDLQSPKRNARILAGFRAAVGWKERDLEEEKGGIDFDQWIMAVGRGADANGSTRLEWLIAAPTWRHLIMFAGLRIAISDEMNVERKTKMALEHAYVRAFFATLETVEGYAAEGMKILE
jgi:hypothetical protein